MCLHFNRHPEVHPEMSIATFLNTILHRHIRPIGYGVMFC